MSSEQLPQTSQDYMAITSMTDVQTTVSSIRPELDVDELSGNIDRLASDRVLGSTGQTQGYEAVPEDNGLSTFNTQQELLSTQTTELGSEMNVGTERSENDQTLFSATLQQAQQMLKAIHEAQDRYGNQDKYGNQETYNNQDTISLEVISPPATNTGIKNGGTEVSEDMDNTEIRSSLVDTAFQDQGYVYTKTFDQQLQLNEMQATYDGSDVTGGQENADQSLDLEKNEVYHVSRGNTAQRQHDEEQYEDDWEEEDTFSKAWAARQSDRQSDILSEISAEEDVVIPQKPLNDVSSAMFLNAYDNSFRETGNEHVLPSEEGLRTTGSKPTSNGTQNTDDTFFATHDTAWRGELNSDDNLGSSDRISVEDQGQNEFGESCPSTDSKMKTGKNLHHTTEEAVDEDNMAQLRTASGTPPTSTSSRSTGCRNGRKAAMVRRELEIGHDDQSSSEDDEPVLRSPSKRKPRKSSSQREQSSNEMRSDDVQVIVTSNGVSNDNAETLHNGHTSVETGIELNGNTGSISDQDVTGQRHITNELKNGYPLTQESVE